MGKGLVVRFFQKKKILNQFLAYPQEIIFLYFKYFHRLKKVRKKQ